MPPFATRRRCNQALILATCGAKEPSCLLNSGGRNRVAGERNQRTRGAASGLCVLDLDGEVRVAARGHRLPARREAARQVRRLIDVSGPRRRHDGRHGSVRQHLGHDRRFQAASYGAGRCFRRNAPRTLFSVRSVRSNATFAMMAIKPSILLPNSSLKCPAVSMMKPRTQSSPRRSLWR